MEGVRHKLIRELNEEQYHCERHLFVTLFHQVETSFLMKSFFQMIPLSKLTGANIPAQCQ